MKPLTMDDNCYSISPETFELLATTVNTLCEFPEIELAEIANREGYAPGCAITIWSASCEHRIEIEGENGLVVLRSQPLDGIEEPTILSGLAELKNSWLQIGILILFIEGYPNPAQAMADHWPGL